MFTYLHNQACPSLMSLMVSLDVKYYVYLLIRREEEEEKKERMKRN